ncbi:DUF6415 family natural product biosynthesis protein [Streptomyces spororaveus]|uniref:Uncharacterized protein n=1 Tax=Streptomyces spororaveus TaxID=284039 RepID=A0ABQ3T2Q9_9ACTN|nr:DUF6415 family natural product biosynthesis protein [Streptomyces spororaveus]GHI74675.1 hypothetical protein Sspor_02360 [Streptomyces spororaveus]
MREEDTLRRLPVDVVAISESVSTILEPRDIPPPAALRGLWLSWLDGHLRLLLSVLDARGQEPPSTGDATLVADAAAYVDDILGDGLEDDAPAAYVQLQELARTCGILLGLATDLTAVPNTTGHSDR